MTSFSPVGPRHRPRRARSRAGAGADFAELFVERKRRSQLQPASSQIENISVVSTSVSAFACATAKVLYGYTNLADRNELLRIVTPAGGQRQA